MADIPAWIPFVFGLVTWVVAMFVGFGAASWRSRGWIEDKTRSMRDDILIETARSIAAARDEADKTKQALYRDASERMAEHIEAEHKKDAEGRSLRERIGSIEALCNERHGGDNRRRS